MAKIVTRKRTWITKSGKVREKTYTYIVEAGGTKIVKGQKQKQQFKTIVKAEKKQGKKLTQNQAIDLIKNSNDVAGIKFNILNELKFNKKYKDGITEKGLERLISQEKLSKSEQFIRNLGYTEKEFEKEFGITSEQIAAGTLTTTGGLTKFTSPTGQEIYFSWEYERGAHVVQ